MEKFIPNFSASETQNQSQMLNRWANRLTSNNLLLLQKLAEIDNKLTELENRLSDLLAQVNNLTNGGS